MSGTKKYQQTRYLLFIPIAVVLIAVVGTRITKKSTVEPSITQTSVQSLRQLTISEKVAISVEIADTPEKTTLGLSYREWLPENHGMLFVFDEPRILNFWMKGMNFPLDMIWIGENNTIVDITENVPNPEPNTPLSELPHYSPKLPAQMVLEVNAGFVKKNGVEVGDTIGFE